MSRPRRIPVPSRAAGALALAVLLVPACRSLSERSYATRTDPEAGVLDRRETGSVVLARMLGQLAVVLVNGGSQPSGPPR